MEAISELNDSELLRQYVNNGRQEAMEVLVERYSELVYGVCRRRTGHRELAEDCVQEVFLLFCRKAPRLLGYASMAGWLYSSADKVAGDAVRREMRRMRHEKSAGKEAARPLNLQEALPYCLEEAMGKLTAKDREAIALRFLMGYSLAEVGKSIQVSEDAARMRVQRALEALRRELTNLGLAASLDELGTSFPKTADVPALPRYLPHPLPKPPLGALRTMTPIAAVTFTSLALIAGGRLIYHSSPTPASSPLIRPVVPAVVQTYSQPVDLSHEKVLNAESALNLIIQSLVGERSMERQFTGFGKPPTHDFPGKTDIQYDPAKKVLSLKVVNGADAAADSLEWGIDSKAGTLTAAKQQPGDSKADTAYHFVSGAIKGRIATIRLDLNVSTAEGMKVSGPLTVTITAARLVWDWQGKSSSPGNTPWTGEMKLAFTPYHDTPQ